MSGDSFWSGLLDVQLAAMKSASDECSRLRRENKALQKTINEFPATASELQDRVTSLELQLAAALKTDANPHA